MLNNCPACGAQYPDFFPSDLIVKYYCGECDDYFWDDGFQDDDIDYIEPDQIGDFFVDGFKVE